MSEHSSYYVQTAGVSICVECSDRAGWAVPWDDAEACRHNMVLLKRPPA